jgi:hypothetical protein
MTLGASRPGQNFKLGTYSLDIENAIFQNLKKWELFQHLYNMSFHESVCQSVYLYLCMSDCLSTSLSVH